MFDGGVCTDVVHAEAGGGALGALEEWSMCCGYRASARDEEQERGLSAAPQGFDDASLRLWSGGELKLVNRRHLPSMRSIARRLSGPLTAAFATGAQGPGF